MSPLTCTKVRQQSTVLSLQVVIALLLAVARSTVKHLVGTPGRDFVMIRIAPSRIRDDLRAHVVKRDGGKAPFRIAGAKDGGTSAHVSSFQVVALLKPSRTPRSFSVAARCSWINHCERQNYQKSFSFSFRLMVEAVNTTHGWRSCSLAFTKTEG